MGGDAGLDKHPRRHGADQIADGYFGYDPRAGDLDVHDYSPTYRNNEWYQTQMSVHAYAGMVRGLREGLLQPQNQASTTICKMRIGNGALNGEPISPMVAPVPSDTSVDIDPTSSITGICRPRRSITVSGAVLTGHHPRPLAHLR